MVLNPRTNLPWGEIKALTRSSLLVALEPHRQLEWQGSPFSSRPQAKTHEDRKSTRLNSSHGYISYAVFCLKKKKTFRKGDRPKPTPCLRRRNDTCSRHTRQRAVA